jgi:hypothetical protein
MRNILLASAMALSLSACNETDVATVETQAQQAAMLACAFLPTIDTVAAIIATKNPAVTTGEQIGSAICAAVQNSPAGAIASTAPAALLSPTAPSPPVVLGVPIHGRFIGVPS